MTTADLQRQKRIRYFRVHDLDKDGYVRPIDFRMLARRLARLRHWPLDSSEYIGLESGLLQIWNDFWRPADHDNTGFVGIDEYLNYMEQWTNAGHSKSSKQIDHIYEHVFSAIDRQGNGEITARELTNYYAACILPTSKAADTFSKLDDNSDGKLSQAEFLQRCSEFFLGSDAKAPGNWLFGPYDTDTAKDLVILIDTSLSMKDQAKLFHLALSTLDPHILDTSDLRLTCFGIEGAWPGTCFKQTLRRYLLKHVDRAQLRSRHRGQHPRAREDGGRAIEDVARHYDWRPAAARAVLFLGDEAPGSDGRLIKQLNGEATDQAIAAAKSAEVTLHTYFVGSSKSYDDPVCHEYNRLATETGGYAFAEPCEVENFQKALEKILCHSTSSESEAEAPVSTAEMTQQAASTQILEMLTQNGIQTTHQIAENLGLPQKTTHEMLHTLESTGQVERYNCHYEPPKPQQPTKPHEDASNPSQQAPHTPKPEVQTANQSSQSTSVSESTVEAPAGNVGQSASPAPSAAAQPASPSKSPAEITKVTTLWRIGTPGKGSKVFLRRSKWTKEHTYRIGSDTDPINKPKVPALMTVPGGGKRQGGTEKLHIEFTLERDYAEGNLIFQYDRLGVEETTVLLDGSLLKKIPGAGEGKLKKMQIPLGATGRGDHVLTITASGGPGDGHFVDYFELRAVPKTSDSAQASLSGAQLRDRLAKFAKEAIFDDFGSEGSSDLEAVHVPAQVNNLDEVSFKTAMGMTSKDHLHQVVRFEEAESHLKRLIEVNPKIGEEIVKLMKEHLSKLKAVIVGVEGETIEHPTYLVGRASDGSLVALKGQVVWT
jgi:DNA-binding HxlR family transcriptional regulator